ncbi:aminoglycoside phosphotransferase [Shewanella halifaxensis HAW-EB4]|uniref:Aminoglycoside phosphotransferase n=1 Tax=Shewanella halifaxensis (strain HAW-EB4) TaxID=458817 RepID=B0TJM0_SHEHH|nr:phosphotransferase [Shewanella halifaxensis]ABZ77016.1 aminoglycoside phosphotransferase [Shewanella halifaxensis HAW-EB4]
MAQALAKMLAPYFVQSGLTSVSLIAPLTQGLSNQNYYIRGVHASKPNAAEWVLRVNSWASSQICNRDDEVSNWLLASEERLAPQIVYVSPDNSFYLSEFFAQNEPVCWSELISANGSHPLTTTHNLWPDAERKLLELLNGLKQLPLPSNVMNVDTQWQRYLARLTNMNLQLTRLLGLSDIECSVADVIAPPSASVHRSDIKSRARQSVSHTSEGNNLAEQALLSRWQQLYQQLLAQSHQIDAMLDSLAACVNNLQFSHRDLNPYNILVVEDKLKCIDFEYACRSHPLCDLAAVLASHSLSSEQRHWLIDSYLATNLNLNDQARDAVTSAVDLYWVFAVCWALQMAFDSLVKEGQLIKLDTGEAYHLVEDYLNCAQQYDELIACCT